jgi:hypothetical protein
MFVGQVVAGALTPVATAFFLSSVARLRPEFRNLKQF